MSFAKSITHTSSDGGIITLNHNHTQERDEQMYYAMQFSLVMNICGLRYHVRAQDQYRRSTP